MTDYEGVDVGNVSKYDDLSRDDLVSRLAAAEDVCVMWAWSPSKGTDRDKATHELWRSWVKISGNKCSPDENSHLTDDLIAALAAKRDAIRTATLEHFFGPADTPSKPHAAS